MIVSIVVIVVAAVSFGAGYAVAKRKALKGAFNELKDVVKS